MNPYTRLTYSLVLALFLWAPGAMMLFKGTMELTTSGLYFLGALVLSYAGFGVIAKMNDNYRHTANRVFMAKQQIELIERRKAEALEREELKRRKDDNTEA